MQILFGIQQNTTVKFTVRLILLSNVKPGIIDFFSNLGAVHNSDKINTLYSWYAVHFRKLLPIYISDHIHTSDEV